MRSALTLMLSLLTAIPAAPAEARDAPWLIAPPFLAEAAQQLGGPDAKVESLGEDEAVIAYCQGLGAQTADALMLSRRLLDRERKSCEGEAIAGEPERVLGLVGLSLDGPVGALTRHQLWRAFAREISDDGKLAANKARSWHDVDPTLADKPIALRVEAPSAVVDALILSVGCLGARNYAKLDRVRLCGGLRPDLPTGPDPIVIRPLSPEGQPVEGISPDAADLASGRYPLARRAYLYMKSAHLPGIPGLSALRDRGAAGVLDIPPSRR